MYLIYTDIYHYSICQSSPTFFHDCQFALLVSIAGSHVPYPGFLLKHKLDQVEGLYTSGALSVSGVPAFFKRDKRLHGYF